MQSFVELFSQNHIVTALADAGSILGLAIVIIAAVRRIWIFGREAYHRNIRAAIRNAKLANIRYSAIMADDPVELIMFVAMRITLVSYSTYVLIFSILTQVTRSSFLRSRLSYSFVPSFFGISSEDMAFVLGVALSLTTFTMGIAGLGYQLAMMRRVRNRRRLRIRQSTLRTRMAL